LKEANPSKSIFSLVSLTKRQSDAIWRTIRDSASKRSRRVLRNVTTASRVMTFVNSNIAAVFATM